MLMCESLKEYEEDIKVPFPIIHNPRKQTDALLTLVGLCKGDYEKVEIVGKKVGCFEAGKVQQLVNILNKYK
jgi:hypothetical protein